MASELLALSGPLGVFSGRQGDFVAKNMRQVAISQGTGQVGMPEPPVANLCLSRA